MKLLFLPAKAKADVKNFVDNIKVKGKIGLVAAVQYVHLLPEIQKYIPNSIIAGQVLGCNAEKPYKVKDQVDAFLYVGSGRFHPIAVAMITKKPTYTISPITKEFSKIDEKEIQDYQKKKQGKQLMFMSAKKVGIIVSVKPIQQLYKKALELKAKLKKEAFIFVTNTFNIGEFENFNDIDCWINTACPRIEGKNIINLEDLPPLE
ncbi:MAG: diphthamide synthesis protein [Candidatus Nanoarchaeia archaeon]|nr:diphthamide synthesis protein [Candidatus Nanoarchaeia archaeon]